MAIRYSFDVVLAVLLVVPGAQADNNATGKTNATLPVLQGGKADGWHAYYEAKSYTAKVDHKGILEISLTDAGPASVAGSVPLNNKKMWTIDIGPGFYDTKWKKRVRHPVTAFLEHSEPSDDARKVRIVAERATGITFETVYEFGPQEIKTWYRAQKGSETPEEQILYLDHKINRIECSDKDREKWKYEQKLYQGGKRKKYDFFESSRVAGDSKSINIEGPFWGKKEITFERGRDKYAEMRPVKYGDVTLRNGSEIWLKKIDADNNDYAAELITITIK